jgi:hypothetical protein
MKILLKHEQDFFCTINGKPFRVQSAKKDLVRKRIKRKI